MKYINVVEGIFLERPNRFIALVKIGNSVESVHVRNTGRCRELLIKGARVFLERIEKKHRKTSYSLMSVYKGSKLVNVDSQIPNKVVKEAIINGLVKEVYKPDIIRSEIKYNNSRFDLYYEKDNKKGFIEVKGVTLENNNIAMFPDAPTQRGTKHLYEMAKAVEEGYRGIIIFLIQMNGIYSFQPNKIMDKDFYNALIYAKKAGVELLSYNCLVQKDVIKLHKKVNIAI